MSAFLVLPAVAASALVLLHSSLFAVSKVVISGASETTRAQILAATGISRRPPLIDINVGRAETELDALPWVRSAVVERHWPTSVRITVVERTPVAFSSAVGGAYTEYDVAGRVLATVTRRPSGLVPVRIAGADPAPGRSASVADRALFATAAALPAKLVHDVVTVDVKPALGVVIALASGRSAIVGSTASLSQKMISLATMLADTIALQGVTQIDLRVPSSPVLSA